MRKHQIGVRAEHHAWIGIERCLVLNITLGLGLECRRVDYLRCWDDIWLMFRSDEQSLATMRPALGIVLAVTAMSNTSARIRQQVWIVLSLVFSRLI